MNLFMSTSHLRIEANPYDNAVRVFTLGQSLIPKQSINIYFLRTSLSLFQQLYSLDLSLCSGAKPAPGICFERVNSAGDPYGNCGKDSKGSFAKCDAM